MVNDKRLMARAKQIFMSLQQNRLMRRLLLLSIAQAPKAAQRPALTINHLSLTIILLFLVSCSPESGYHKFGGFALGTSYNITVALDDTTGLRGEVEGLFGEVERSMSVYDPQSLLSRLNRNETDSVDRHIAHCIAVAARASEAGGGVYDITLKPVIEAWGFNAAPPRHAPNVDSLMQLVGWRKIKVVGGRLVKDDPRVQIDLNSVAKGYSVDLLAELMQARGTSDYMLEVGGEIVCRGGREGGGPWRIGIDKPLQGNHIAGAATQAVLTLGDGAMATSGNYRRFYTDSLGRTVVHTISGLTGRAEPTDMLSATVTAPDCATADAFATMLMAVGSARAKEILAREPDIKAYLIYNGGVYVSQGLDIK
jgi:thiamine biosynthesis lipoprotein